MALVTLTVLPSGRSTASPDTGDATGIASTDTYQFANDGRTIVIAKADTTANLTLDIERTLDGQSVTDPVVALTTDWKVLGPFPPAIYNDASGFCSFTTSAAGDAVVVRIS
jgi:hypothetical protein